MTIVAVIKVAVATIGRNTVPSIARNSVRKEWCVPGRRNFVRKDARQRTANANHEARNVVGVIVASRSAAASDHPSRVAEGLVALAKDRMP